MKKLIIPSAEVKTLLNIFPHGVIAFDVETTGLSPFSDKMIELAAVKVDANGNIETFRTLINPECEIPQQTIDIHGITNLMTHQAPSIEKVLPEFMSFIEDLPLIAHNAQFDIGFLIRESQQLEISLGTHDIYDSCQIARSAFKKKEKVPTNFKLSSLAEFFEIPLNHHQALDDSIASLRIFARALELVESDKPHFIKTRCLLFNTDSLKKIQTEDLDKKHALLVEKIPTQESVYITYKGGTRGDEPRPIRPIGLIPLPQGLVLYAECLLTKVHKSFLVKKIKTVEEKGVYENSEK